MGNPVEQGCPDVPERRSKLLVPTNSQEPNINFYSKLEGNNNVHKFFLIKLNSALHQVNFIT